MLLLGSNMDRPGNQATCKSLNDIDLMTIFVYYTSFLYNIQVVHKWFMFVDIKTNNTPPPNLNVLMSSFCMQQWQTFWICPWAISLISSIKYHRYTLQYVTKQFQVISLIFLQEIHKNLLLGNHERNISFKDKEKHKLQKYQVCCHTVNQVNS